MKKMSDLLALALVFLLGTLPTVAILIWIERNMALPWVGTWIGWPWIFLDADFAVNVFFDVVLITLFASLSAWLLRGRPRVAVRIFAGLLCIGVMGIWQPTGHIFYQLIPSAVKATLLSVTLYWAFLAGALYAPRKYLFALLAAAGIATPLLSVDRLIATLVITVVVVYSVHRKDIKP